MKRFKTPRESLGELDAEAASTLIAAAADVALVLDDDGTIRDVAFAADDLAAEWGGKWTGRRWTDIVTAESRTKVDDMLREPSAPTSPRWRHVNHPWPTGPDVPVLYATMRLAGRGRLIAIGRDLRSTAALQQRLMDVQQSMERDYLRLRHVETRYRLLFHTTAEAVLVIDASGRKIVEANPAATQLLGEKAERLIGRTFPEDFAPADAEALEALLGAVRATGRADSVRASLGGGDRTFLVTAALFRQESTALFLLRLFPIETADSTVATLPRAKSKLLRVVESAPDGLVVTAQDGRILTANTAFLDLAQLATEEQARGELLDRWLGRPGVDLNVMTANLRQHGSIRLFATMLRGEYGASVDVEVSAVAVDDGDHPYFGFTIRNVGRRPSAEPRGARELPRSVEQLAELVGRVPLKDLVRQTTDVIERLCIETALELTGDNRASAAELLGLSRQSLYVKLRRYGLGDLGDGDGEEGADL